MAFSVVAPMLTHVGTDIFSMLVPVWPCDHVDAKFAVFAIAIHILIVLCVFKVDAWGERDKLVHVVRIKVFLDLSEAVEHLSRAH